MQFIVNEIDLSQQFGKS